MRFLVHISNCFADTLVQIPTSLRLTLPLQIELALLYTLLDTNRWT